MTSPVVEIKVHDLVHSVRSSLKIEHPELMTEAMLTTARNHAMICYNLDMMRGLEYERETLEDVNESQLVIEHVRKTICCRAEKYAMYQAAARLWTRILEVAKSLGLCANQQGVGEALFVTLVWMAGSFKSLAADPLLYACDKDVRSDLSDSLATHVSDLHDTLLQGKVFARSACATAYLEKGSLDSLPSPLAYIHLGIGGVGPRDFSNGVHVSRHEAKDDARLQRCLDAYRAHAFVTARDKRINLPVLQDDWVPVYTFCESNESRLEFRNWITRTLRRHTERKQQQQTPCRRISNNLLLRPIAL
jgi:hypothetical protein